HTFEQLVTAAVGEPQQCPQCHATNLERLIGLPTAGRPSTESAVNCRGDGPPCGAPWCGRTTNWNAS
ncbi:MAG: hypothetical protein NZ703_12475, partial [Gemmataceae bacterium]|nr:hypothetical protein [Gemmataceae bacterium]